MSEQQDPEDILTAAKTKLGLLVRWMRAEQAGEVADCDRELDRDAWTAAEEILNGVRHDIENAITIIEKGGAR
jgi:hypothetical protein